MSSTKLLLFIFLYVLNGFSQDKYLKHKVLKGESFYSISQKYDVTVNEVLKINFKLKDNLKPGFVLLIPNRVKSSDLSTIEVIHEVQPKETLYGIAKKYGVTVESINTSNPNNDVLDIGEKLLIKTTNKKKNTKETISINESDEQIIHKVLPKETKYSIAKKYKKTVHELEILNPAIASGLPSGFEMIIQVGAKTLNTTEPQKNIEAVIAPEKEVIGSSSTTIINESDAPKEKVLILGSLLLEGLVEKASEFIGVRYRSGGTNKNGFDCSGLMITVFNAFDIKLPRTSTDQADFGTNVLLTDAKKGDLIFFATGGGKSINHVGMITDVLDNEIKFIHASVHGGVMISSNNETYYATRFVKINRVIE